MSILGLVGAGAAAYAGLRVANDVNAKDTVRLDKSDQDLRGLIEDLRGQIKELRLEARDWRGEADARMRRIEERCFSLMGPHKPE